MDDAASIRAFGLDVVTALCERLIAGGAPGIHFYTMNQSALTLELCARLGLGPAARGVQRRWKTTPSSTSIASSGMSCGSPVSQGT
jgi:hypothetical protein